MKRFIIILCTFVITITSCDHILEKYPLDEISSGSFWKNEYDLQLATNRFYQTISRTATLDNQSADFVPRTPNAVSSGTNTTSNTDDIWTNSYNEIRKANDLLEHIGQIDLSSELKEQYEAEARFFRAYHHFQLIKRFGDATLVTHTLDFTSPEMTSPRTARQEVTSFIIKELQWAAAHLPAKSKLSATMKGHIDRDVAWGFLSRVALYEGTHAKYHGYGKPSELLTIARDAAKEVIVSGEYDLFTGGFEQMFYEANENNVEVMLAFRYQENITGVSPRGRGMIIDASINPTKNLAEAFLCTDGLPVDVSDLFEGYTTLSSEFNNRDPRMAASIWKPGLPHEGGSPLIPKLTVTPTGYMVKKPGDPTALTQTFMYTDDILMRYAEVLLNYAEAVYELDGAISDSDLDISINKLRDRVSMPHLTNNFVNGNNPKSVTLDMKEEIRRERRVELAGECFRYDDLIRWKTAETDLPKTILGFKFHQADYPNVVPGVDVKLDGNGFIIVQSADTRFFATPKNYLFPVPLREISLNPLLGQNDGWDK